MLRVAPTVALPTDPVTASGAGATTSWKVADGLLPESVSVTPRLNVPAVVGVPLKVALANASPGRGPCRSA